ncbi:hypothetical protein AB0D78_34895 [Streptomyces avermitilis]|uniref:hypothetical protein n=1 Tax=Streptomyces avermitilis TaxID=33903 RepID=UPI0033FCF9BB
MNSATTAQTSAEETTAAGIVARTAGLYLGRENRRTPRHPARAAIARKAGQ